MLSKHLQLRTALPSRAICPPLRGKTITHGFKSGFSSTNSCNIRSKVPLGSLIPLRARFQSRSSRSHVCGVASQSVMFTSSRDGITLPIEPVQMLGLEPGSYQDSVLNQAYDDITTSPVEQGYSQQTIVNRNELLDSVLTGILSSKGKRIEMTKVHIPYELLPGGMSLLTEVGQDELVIFLGQELLGSGELNEFEDVKQDLMLTMGIAKYNIAYRSFAGSGQFEKAKTTMNEALDFIRNDVQTFFAPGLAAKIKVAIEDIDMRWAIKQLEGPFSEGRLPFREEATEIITKTLLASQAASDRTAQNPSCFLVPKEYMSKLMGVFTVKDIPEVLDWVSVAQSSSSYTWTYPGLMERVAVAHVLAGFLDTRPDQIAKALKIVEHLPASGGIMVIRAVSNVLLGNIDQARAILQNAEELSKQKETTEDLQDELAMNEIWWTQGHKFINQDNTPEQDSSRAGACKYAELWLVQVASKLFSDTAQFAPSISIERYFDQAQIEVEGSEGASMAASKKELASFSEGPVAGKKATPAAEVAAAVSGEGKGTAAWLLLGAAAVAAGAYFFGPGREGAAWLSQLTAPTVATEPSTTADPALTPDKAERLVRMWQAAKQASLGAKHDMSLLSNVLANPMLDDMLEKASAFKEDSWFMKYKLHEIKVNSVETPKKVRGNTPTRNVMASVTESATLFNPEGKLSDSYESSYTVKYKVIQGSDNAWRISSLEIVDG